MNGVKRSCFIISPEFGRETNAPVSRSRAAQPANAAMILMAAALASLTFWIVWLV